MRVSLWRVVRLVAQAVRDVLRETPPDDPLQPCQYCNAWVSSHKRVCPHCGAILIPSPPWKVLLVVAVAGVGAVGCASLTYRHSPTYPSEVAAAPTVVVATEHTGSL